MTPPLLHTETTLSVGRVFLRRGAPCEDSGEKRSLDEAMGGWRGIAPVLHAQGGAGRTRGPVLEEDEMKKERRSRRRTRRRNLDPEEVQGKGKRYRRKMDGRHDTYLFVTGIHHIHLLV